MAARRRSLTLAWFLISLFLPVVLAGQTAVEAGWNPIEGPSAGSKFVGDKVRASCHVSEAKTYASTPMSKAGAPAAQTEILRFRPRLTYRQGGFQFRILLQGNQRVYSVSYGKETIVELIIWAFGMGVAGQTYVFSPDGSYFQSLVSYYRDTNALGPTWGVPAAPHDLEEALGLRTNENDARLCITCHTAGAIIGGKLEPEKSVPGVHCEACHGPGAQHVTAVAKGSGGASSIFNPGRLPAFELDNFCGACHRTWEQVQLSTSPTFIMCAFSPIVCKRVEAWTPWTRASVA